MQLLLFLFALHLASSLPPDPEPLPPTSSADAPKNDEVDPTVFLFLFSISIMLSVVALIGVLFGLHNYFLYKHDEAESGGGAQELGWFARYLGGSGRGLIRGEREVVLSEEGDVRRGTDGISLAEI